MKNICNKSIVICIILLLIGVSVSSAISIDTKSNISNESVEDCGCREIDNRKLVVLERQLNRIEVYSKLLLVLSRYNPEIKEKCEELLNIINSKSQWDFPIICAILDSIENQIQDILKNLEDLISEYQDNPIIHSIISNFYYIVEYIDTLVMGLYWIICIEL